MNLSSRGLVNLKSLFILLFGLCLGVGVAILWRPGDVKNRSEMTETQPQREKHLNTSSITRADRTANVQDTSPKDFIQDMKKSLEKPIGFGDLESWLESKKGDSRSHAEASVIVGMLTENSDLIRKGIQADPENAHLLFMGATWNAFPPEERLEMSKKLQAADPRNAMAGYLATAQLFKAGHSEAAIAALKAASAGETMNDFRGPTILMTEEAYIAAGLSPDAAKVRAEFGYSVGHLIDLRSITRSLKALDDSLTPEQRSEVQAHTALMGQRLNSEPRMGFLGRILGISLEEGSLNGLQDDAPSPYPGLTANEARQSLRQERAELQELIKLNPAPEAFTSPELINRYVDSIRLVGEIEAAKWFNKQHMSKTGE